MYDYTVGSHFANFPKTPRRTPVPLPDARPPPSHTPTALASPVSPAQWSTSPSSIRPSSSGSSDSSLSDPTPSPVTLPSFSPGYHPSVSVASNPSFGETITSQSLAPYVPFSSLGYNDSNQTIPGGLELIEASNSNNISNLSPLIILDEPIVEQLINLPAIPSTPPPSTVNSAAYNGASQVDGSSQNQGLGSSDNDELSDMYIDYFDEVSFASMLMSLLRFRV
ncbi:hypothetical protein CC1G_02272 [Coprinopsis cinerea okayama7|uniref:Uncharacterized protein n=1 Tax=Coprinopsis cinerea (strain Okayama-7 / 130 / ATCC MYA-4618 / FGSC 9003) TaxID=240176 RepID=A8N7L5_COPC7|nr:hypothetical protein CC1G_02272 [Coprinopsis cinerea okayama7\|eukprot:XP_001830821.2 hypothetical protein CC1G_02272 [Coprinopsis cinerea okayama7\